MDTFCNICNSPTTEHARMVVLKKYNARLLRCSNCGFMFVENPSWLDEAYAEPINRSDTGYVRRNLWARDRMRVIIESHLNPGGIFLDYAAGYGLFVRLMRDIGYDFRWSDLYCKNLFARGFEVPEPLVGPYEAATAFEVFEHLTNPIEEMQKLSTISSCIIFTTLLLPDPAPQPQDWWYYGLEHGQHIAFYTRRSLELLAARFGFQLATDDSEEHLGLDLHVFSKKPVPLEFFSRMPSRIPRWRFWAKQKNKVQVNRGPLPG
jgi:hypothetical protein